ncbi:hypothetical protein MN086_07025 [Sulfurovum sp. XGS-02]|uniref:hypothetical protein n=1 Tax=Sulfurovum sp. XGS-02 TaxID=2925411 RepID=UPI00206A1B3F|nr:hypothetical protein [Sulfurovum sp. XGS-02]UPT76805.1 hypothetical protein MN086_07025 [Sulfurovum sp. XGS-02]
MFRLNNIKQNLLILSFATLLAGCGGGGTTATDAATTDLTTTSTPKRVQIDISAVTTEDSATINWTPYGYTTKSVEYGTTNKYGSEVSVQEEGTVTLYNLQANTEYHYRIVSEDEKGRPVVSNDNIFTTLAESTQPIVTEPAPTDPVVTDPIVTEPAPTDPVVTDPIVTEPAPTDPVITDPIVTEPAPTDPVVTDPIVTEPAPVCQSGPAMQQGQVKDSVSGTGLANVTVTINGCVTQTDAQGFYALNDIAVSDRAVVTFELDGYYMNSEIIAIQEYSDGTTLSPNYLEFSLDKYDDQNTADSQNGKLWSYFFGIDIAGGIYTDTAGNPYSGNATAQVAYEDVATEKGREVFPGAYEGKNAYGDMVPFVSYGLMVVDLKDESGNALNISDDITLRFHTATGATAEIVPLWYYDYAQGIWIEEGYATRLADGKYEGTISHPGTWSLSQPVEEALGIYTDRILYPDGTPAKNLHIHAIGDNWIRTDLSTDENGEFEIEVIPGKAFTLKAYHSTDKYTATYNGTISAVASGEIVNNSSL